MVRVGWRDVAGRVVERRVGQRVHRTVRFTNAVVTRVRTERGCDGELDRAPSTLYVIGFRSFVRSLPVPPAPSAVLAPRSVLGPAAGARDGGGGHAALCPTRKPVNAPERPRRAGRVTRLVGTLLHSI